PAAKPGHFSSTPAAPAEILEVEKQLQISKQGCWSALREVYHNRAKFIKREQSRCLRMKKNHIQNILI
ncbi:hypothetical protein, partial [Parasphingorhabdus sp.]|uniref:hypothetical protein n=1 Tax=Parasphingorhabdus sp. TaxID=2709688 RepID=UPI003297AC74